MKTLLIVIMMMLGPDGEPTRGKVYVAGPFPNVASCQEKADDYNNLRENMKAPKGEDFKTLAYCETGV